MQILHLEDDRQDAQLVRETLESGGIECQMIRVENQRDFASALERGSFDVILADYTLPSFDGLSALEIAQSMAADIPFIFVSGTLGEEVAIEAIRRGATDYVFKTRLEKIVHSVQRALREAHERAELKRTQDALKRSEAYLAEAQRLSHTGSFGWDVASGEIYWSQETFRIFEYPPAAKITIERILDRTHPDDRAAVREWVERIVREKREFDFEHRLLVPDGVVKHVRVVGRPAPATTRGFEFVGAVTDVTERRGADEIRIAERTRIAGDLHDTLLQSFQGVMLLFHAADGLLPATPLKAKQMLERALTCGQQAIAEGRDAVFDLRFPERVDLTQALHSFGQELIATEDPQERSRLPAIHVLAQGAPTHLPSRMGYEVCRIAFEALRNAFRHAHARRIEVEIVHDPACLRVFVRDDGKGIDPDVLERGGRVGHWGMAGMRERAQRIGARLAIGPRAGAGTEVAITVPLV